MPAQSPAPLPPPGELNRCLALIKAGHYSVARARLTPIVALHPDWPRALFFLALTYHEEHRYELARPHFARALELDPQEHNIRPFYGWCLYYLGEVDLARDTFREYLKVRPDYADAHYALGLIAFDGDELSEARACLEAAIRYAAEKKDAPVEGKARARLGDVYVRLDDLPQARRELERAVQLRPDAYEAYFKLSRVLQRLGEPEAAAAAHAKFKEVKARVRPDPARQPD